jgi:hypothetical protein
MCTSFLNPPQAGNYAFWGTPGLREPPPALPKVTVARNVLHSLHLQNEIHSNQLKRPDYGPLARDARAISEALRPMGGNPAWGE